MRTWIKTALFLLCLSSFIGCSLPPANPVTRQDLMETGIYRLYKVDESPEEILRALNAHGEVILEGKRNIQGKNYPVYVKLLATRDGLELVDYDR